MELDADCAPSPETVAASMRQAARIAVTSALGEGDVARWLATATPQQCATIVAIGEKLEHDVRAQRQAAANSGYQQGYNVARDRFRGGA